MHSQMERDAAVKKFNDPEDDNSILVTSLRISSTAVNLQYTCCDVVFVDVHIPFCDQLSVCSGLIYEDE